MELREWFNCCIYSNKDKNFKANHNYYYRYNYSAMVVSIVTKIRILKQITTVLLLVAVYPPLYL